MNRRNFLRGTVSVMALAGVLKFAKPDDGVELISMDLSKHLTDENAWFVASERSIEDVMIEISNKRDDNGLLISSPRHLIVRPDMAETARRVLRSVS